jgi:hypothetical protein
MEKRFKYLIERVIFTFHVGIAYRFAQNVFVERASKVALEQLVIINGLGNDAADEFEVAQVIGIAMRRRIDHVGNAIAGRCSKQCVHRVKNLA